MTKRTPVPTEPTPEMIEAAYPILTGRATDTPARARRAIYEIWETMLEVAPQMKATVGITKQQAEVHAFIAQYFTDHGFSPTRREIVLGTSCNCTKAVGDALKTLEKCGIIERHGGHSRVIEMLVWPGEKRPKPRVIRGKKK